MFKSFLILIYFELIINTDLVQFKKFYSLY